ncbi:MAG: lactate utilization protein [Bacillota bacterium]|nr:lactate utilization protein [Bacillota bacterium]
MNKVCTNWKAHFPTEKVGLEYYEEFAGRAQNVSAEVFRVKNPIEAQEIMANLIKFTNASKIVAVDGPLQDAANITEHIKSLGVEIYTEQNDIAEHAESSDIGISAAEFGIAETGSVVTDAMDIAGRLVSMLSTIHVVFMQSANVVAGIEQAFEIISEVYHRGYISFITGPSRTADIERVLTIGCHGPSRLVIIAVDEESGGGVN